MEEKKKGFQEDKAWQTMAAEEGMKMLIKLGFRRNPSFWSHSYRTFLQFVYLGLSASKRLGHYIELTDQRIVPENKRVDDLDKTNVPPCRMLRQTEGYKIVNVLELLYAFRHHDDIVTAVVGFDGLDTEEYIVDRFCLYFYLLPDCENMLCKLATALFKTKENLKDVVLTFRQKVFFNYENLLGLIIRALRLTKPFTGDNATEIYQASLAVTLEDMKELAVQLTGPLDEQKVISILHSANKGSPKILNLIRE